MTRRSFNDLTDQTVESCIDEKVLKGRHFSFSKSCEKLGDLNLNLSKTLELASLVQRCMDRMSSII